MYARNISLRLKPGCIQRFEETFKSRLLPLLSLQQGFQDELTYSGASMLDVTLITIWDSQKDADAFGRAMSPEMMRHLEDVIDEAPSVRSSGTVSSVYKNAAAL